MFKVFNKFFRKFFAKKQIVAKIDSVTLAPGEYHHVHSPTTATERTVQRIQAHNSRVAG